MTIDIGSSTEQKRCVQCGGSFACGAAGGSCWCFTLPKVMAVPADSQAGCLCPKCLGAAVKTDPTGERIEILPAAIYAYLRNVGPYGPALSLLWRRLREWAKPRGLWNSSTVSFGISYDNPMTTPAAECRYDACVEISPDQAIDGASRGSMLGGTYLLVPFRGTAGEIGAAFRSAMDESLPRCRRRFDYARPIFERYHGIDSDGDVFDCEICVPVS